MISFILCLLIGSVSCWVNTYDQPFSFQCPPTQFLAHIQSIHSNHNEDRLFEFSCRDPPQSEATLDKCEWSGYVNEFDLPMTYQCPGNAILAGVSSYHDNHHEDRRFKFYCCDVPGFLTATCYFTGYENDFDLPLDYVVPTDKVLRGVDSYHDNGKEDRRFKFEICDLDLNTTQ